MILDDKEDSKVTSHCKSILGDLVYNRRLVMKC